ncbi:MAG: nitrous oxide reductase family maturation protein NosD [Candidatus Hodarchaeota archaeon]
MKAKTKVRLTILVTLVFIFSPLISTTLRFGTGLRDKHEITVVSESPFILGTIYINDDDPNCNWSVAKEAGICTGNGTYAKPYVIEDLVIDGEDFGNCILIENSNVYFRIENCTTYNSGRDEAGIRLSTVNNSQLIDNHCGGIRLSDSYNNNISGNYVSKFLGFGSGIFLSHSNSNNISGNTVNFNNEGGIKLSCSNYTTISGNTINNNQYGIEIWFSLNNNVSGNTVNNNQNGIKIWFSDTITVSGNIMNECGLIVDGSLKELCSHEIDNANLVNNKPIYYYTNEINLKQNNFTNAGQVILVNCSDSIISDLNTSFCNIGISLHFSENNIISRNTANNNTSGTRLSESNYNIITGNSVNNNTSGIRLFESNGNTISGNTANNNLYGIDLVYYSNYNTISGNTVNNNPSGIYLAYGYKNTISGNSLNDNKDGIWLSESNYTTISGNIVYNNNKSGIRLSYSNHNTISGNTAYNNSESGIRLFTSNYNTISGNFLLGNEVCIVEEYCEGNVFEDNDCGVGDGKIQIPGYNLFFLLGILSTVAIILIEKNKERSKIR